MYEAEREMKCEIDEKSYLNSLTDALTRCCKLRIERLEKNMVYKLYELLEKDIKTIEADLNEIKQDIMEMDIIESVQNNITQSDDSDFLDYLYGSDDSDDSDYSYDSD